MSRAHILIVDDVPANVEVLGRALENDYDIQFATSGVEGLRLALEEPPDLILLDVMMPGMDGYETCRQLRTQPRLREIPVVFVTAMTDTEAETRGLTLGAADYIAKPFDLGIARLRIANLLERHRLKRQLEMALLGAGQGLWEWETRSEKVAINPRWAQPLGYQDEELSPWEIPWTQLVHPDDQPALINALSQARRDPRGLLAEEVRLRNHADYWTWVSLQGKACAFDDHGLPLLLMGTFMDISRRKAAEEALTERETRLATLLASMQDVVMVVDTAGIIRTFHRPAHCCFLATAGDVVGRSYGEVLPPSACATFDDALVAVAGHGRVEEFECAYPCSGDTGYFQVTINLLADSRRFPTGFLAVVRDISRQKRAELEIRQLAFYDALTGLPNRRLLDERLAHALAVSLRKRQFGALMLLDLDQFKALNDRLGHDQGDQLLIQLSQRLRNALRQTDTVARWGGDEFVVLIEELGQDDGKAREMAQRVAEKILTALEPPFPLGGESYPATVSIGVRVFAGWVDAPDAATLPEETGSENGEGGGLTTRPDPYGASPRFLGPLLKQADQAMYRAKGAGRNTFVLY